ncbi:MAG: (2Fe-2S)-binding protein [Tetrasphaera sp.]
MASGPSGFFAAEQHAEHSHAPTPWLRLADLADDPQPLLARIAEVRQHLRGVACQEVELRVAASTVHLGLVARLAAAGLAAAVSASGRLGPDDCWWQPGSRDPVPLSVASSRPADRASRPADRASRPADRASRPANGTSRPAALGWLESAALVTDVVRRHTGTSRRVLWGNVASGINTAAVLLALHAPNDREAIVRHLAAATGDPRLAGEPGPYGSGFRRRSCCLAYRADLGYCGDCVLTHPARRTSTE